MKVFVAHLTVMGILKKNSLEQYWSRDSILNMPFFGHYMSRNHFQNILWNLHISDPDETNPQKKEADHDPLFLVRPMVQLLEMGHHVYFGNYYNSPDLIDLLYKRKMHACGTVRKNQKSLPLAVTQAKLKPGETVFHHKNNLLALKWMDKREVYILSGLHKATNEISKKINYKGQKVMKPQPVFLYNQVHVWC